MDTIDFKSLPPAERLDTILTLLMEKGALPKFKIMQTEFPIMGINAKLFDIDGVMDKLIDDGHVKEIPNHVTYSDYVISFDGEVLIQAGGYRQLIVDEQLEKDNDILHRSITIRNLRISAVAAVWAGVGAIGIFSWEITKTLYHHWDHISYFLQRLFSCH